MDAYLDTHVAAYLAADNKRKLSRAAKQAMERYDLLCCPAVRIELQFLFEIQRSPHPADFVLQHLEDTIGLRICTISFDRVARAACHESWTRDAFDRLIVAHARAAGDAYLITSDEHIRAHYPKAVW
jgi:PIN domain nuclease of toxin-antitoxin system